MSVRPFWRQGTETPDSQDGEKWCDSSGSCDGSDHLYGGLAYETSDYICRNNRRKKIVRISGSEKSSGDRLCGNGIWRDSPDGNGIPEGTCGRMDEAAMGQFFEEQKTELVVDATHPYAAVVSENVAAACKKAGVEYLRLIRESSTSETEMRFWWFRG